MKIDDAKLSELMTEIERLVAEDTALIAGFYSSYNLNITDVEAGEYSIVLKDNQINIEAGTLEEADCKLSMKEKSFKKLLKGDLNTAAAFMTGQLKVKGNMGLALKLEGTLKKLNFE